MTACYVRLETKIGSPVTEIITEACNFSKSTGVDVEVKINSLIFTISKDDVPSDVYAQYMKRIEQGEMDKRRK